LSAENQFFSFKMFLLLPYFTAGWNLPTGTAAPVVSPHTHTHTRPTNCNNRPDQKWGRNPSLDFTRANHTFGT
jgi:hypothetical protein